MLYRDYRAHASIVLLLMHPSPKLYRFRYEKPVGLFIKATEALFPTNACGSAHKDGVLTLTQPLWAVLAKLEKRSRVMIIPSYYIGSPRVSSSRVSCRARCPCINPGLFYRQWGPFWDHHQQGGHACINHHGACWPPRSFY